MSMKIASTATRKLKSTVMFVASFALALGSVSFATPQFFSQVAHAESAWTVDSALLNNDNCILATLQCSTVQAAVAAASSGDTISILAGTYTEVGQIIIDKNLTIIGADKMSTIIKPAQSTTGDYLDDSSAWFVVNPGMTFNLSKVTLDGAGQLITNAILSRGLGTINGNIITNIGYNQSGPDYSGAGIALYNANVTVSNNSFSNIGREGIFAKYSTTATIAGNTYTGKGHGDWLDYAVEASSGAQLVIENNYVSNNYGVAIFDDSTSAGVLISSSDEKSTTVTLTSNTMTSNTIAIDAGYDVNDISSVTAKNNNLSGNDIAISSKTKQSVEAANNYWGTSSSAAIASMVSGPVNFKPYYTDSWMTVLSSNNPTTGAATDITLDDATLNGTNGNYDAIGHSFWVSLAPFSTAIPTIPSDVYSTPDLGFIAASTESSASLASLTANGVHTNLPTIAPSTTYYYAAWSNVDGAWYPGVVQSFTTSPVPDTTAPTVPVATSPSNGSVQPSALSFAWNAASDISPVTYELAYSPNASRDANGILDSSVTLLPVADTHKEVTGLADGYIFWQVRAKDAAGNYSQWSGIWGYAIDGSYPVISFEAQTPALNAVVGGTIPVAVKITDNNIGAYNLRIQDGAPAPLSLGLAYIYSPVSGVVNTYSWNTKDGAKKVIDGTHTILATTTDKAGNNSTITRSIVVDNTAPSVVVTSSDEGKTVGNKAKVSLSASINDAHPWTYYFSVNGVGKEYKTSDTSINPSFIFDTTDLASGTYKLQVEAKDKVGNKDSGSTDYIFVTVDNTAPVAPVIVPAIVPTPVAPVTSVAPIVGAAPYATAAPVIATAANTTVGEVLGASTTVADAPAVAGAETSKDVAAEPIAKDGFNSAWYWLLTIPVAGAAWWALAAFRRRES